MATEIFVNQNKLDFEEINQLPVKIKKQVNNFYDLASSSGSKVDTPVKTFNLPATKSNQKALCFPTRNAITENPLRQLDELIVLSNGFPVFCGTAKYEGATRNCKYPDGYSMKPVGDAASFWNLLEGCMLCSLDLGTIEHNIDTIKESWDMQYQDGWAGVFAPFVHGCPSGDKRFLGFDNTQNPAPAIFDDSGAWHANDFRLSVYFKTIIDGIEKKTGYKIKSDFFEKEWFQEWVHNFAVGDSLNNVTSGLEPQCFGGANHISSPVGAASVSAIEPFFAQQIVFGNSCGEWETFQPSEPRDTFTASQTDLYCFDILAWLDCPWTLSVYVNNAATGIELSDNFTPPAPWTHGHDHQDIKLQLNAGDEVTFRTKGGCDYGAFLVSWNGTKTNLDGATYDVAANLPCDKSVKDFLRGISHMFNLEWAIDPITRTVCVEPRFDYWLPIKNDPDCKFEKCAGFYHTLLPSENMQRMEELCIDCSSIKYSSGNKFKQFLAMGFKEDKSNYHGINLHDQYEDFAVRPYDARIKFNNCPEGETDSENPYFCELHQGIDTVRNRRQTGFSATQLPWSAAIKEGENLCARAADYEACCSAGFVYRGVTEITVEIEPRPPYIYGEFGEVLNPDVQPTWDVCEGAPIVAQYITLDQSFAVNFELGNTFEWCFSATYSDSTDFLRDGLRNLRGLVSMFYQQYFAMIRNSDKLKAKSILKSPDVSAETFRHPKIVNINHTKQPYILTAICNFDPSTFCPTDVELIEWCEATRCDKSFTEHYQLGYTGCDRFCQRSTTFSSSDMCEPDGLYDSSFELDQITLGDGTVVPIAPAINMGGLSICSVIESVMASVGCEGNAFYDGNLFWEPVDVNDTACRIDTIRFLFNGQFFTFLSFNDSNCPPTKL